MRRAPVRTTPAPARRGGHRPVRALAVTGTIAVASLLAACGSGDSDDSPEELQEKLAEELQDSGIGLSDEQADCFAGVLVEEIGADELNDVDFTAEEPPEELAEAFGAASLPAVEECEIDPSAPGPCPSNP